jgi:hypothetical protein
MPKTATSATGVRVSISISGDKDPKVISFLRMTYGVSRLPVKIMDAVNAFFLVFSMNYKKSRGDKEIIRAAQDSITTLELQVRSILWKLQSDGIDTSWYKPINSFDFRPDAVREDEVVDDESDDEGGNGYDDGFLIDIS